MQSSEIRSRFLEFFKKRGHAVIESASLVTSDEKEVTNPTLFNTAGMQPLIPYLLGKPHPLGKRLVNVQKCLRTVDIDDIGDKTHATFFEMMGNWSLGDYFKKEAINWSYEFLTDKKEGLGLNPSQLYITVFEGDANAPRDDEAADIWKEVFKKNGVDDIDGRIFFMPAENNWWQAGDNGPCGPDTEMYYDVGNTFKGKGITKEQFIKADSERTVVEVWNDVFMQYEKKNGKIVGKLAKPSVDTGAGLERLAMTMQGVDNIYDTDLLKDVFKLFSFVGNLQHRRIIVDHLRAAIFLVNDGVTPSNKDRGYILRRLLRRSFVYIRMNLQTNTDKNTFENVLDCFMKIYSGVYDFKQSNILGVLKQEDFNFSKNMFAGMDIFQELVKTNKFISGKAAFDLATTFGFPIEVTKNLAEELGVEVDINEYNSLFKAHQSLSRSGASQKFKGGLADANDPMVVRYHTATHLLHQALHDVLGEGVMQKGSNITADRLRFDFTHGAKMTDEEKKRVEDIVNEKIAQRLPMNQVIMPRAEAEKTGARHFFGEKYGDEISIYFIGNDLETAYSKEFCGGPHVKNTSELAGETGKWKFVIQKEEAVAQGIRRIKAILK